MHTQNDDEMEDYEKRLQRRLHVLQKQMEAGKVKISQDLSVIESLKKVRYAADGTIDLNTVDGSVRSLALLVTAMEDREQLKQAMPLADIQSAYFSFIEIYFGTLYKAMLENNLTPHDAGVALSRNTSTAEELNNDIDEFLNHLYDLWLSAADAAHAHVEDFHGLLKGVFGGDLFPAANENIASKCGIYTDTIILPDPFLRSKHIFKLLTTQQKTYYFIKHGLNILQYKELACANITTPIVVILPDMNALDENEMQFYYRLGQDDALIHAAKIFGRTFESFDDLMDFAKSLDTIEKVESEIADKNRVLFDTEWDGDFQDKLHRATKHETADLIQSRNPGIIVASQSLGRMCTSNELLIKARRLRGTPIIDAPTSWQYFVWKLEYDAANLEGIDNLHDLHVVRGLQSLAEKEMEWLGNVPPKALIEIRKENALDEIRSIFSKGIQELSLANPTNFHRTSDQIFDNINAAFDEHKKSIKLLSSKKWKFAGIDIAACLAVGSLAVAAAATGQPVWGLVAVAADQLLPAPKLKDIPRTIKALALEGKQLKQSPVGMLFKHSQQRA